MTYFSVRTSVLYLSTSIFFLASGRSFILSPHCKRPARYRWFYPINSSLPSFIFINTRLVTRSKEQKSHATSSATSSEAEAHALSPNQFHQPPIVNWSKQQPLHEHNTTSDSFSIMPPLRKNNPKSWQEAPQPLTDIRMSANSTDSTLINADRDSAFERAPSSHPVYGKYHEYSPVQPPTPVRRNVYSDQSQQTLSNLMIEPVQDNSLEPPNGMAFPPFAPRADSSYSESGTRSSSPYPSPYPASTPFVSRSIPEKSYQC